ncbi:MAG: fluoride efflux transporter CrcB [Thermoleophilia bacterium]|nr:fluoride efflux transporter CrcB [Thermoleophilia bacterium]
MSALTWLLVALAGGAGAVARLGAGEWVTRRAPRDFPWGTFAVNQAGACALGALVGAGPSARMAVVAGAGFLGAFTTFSTWMLEADRLDEARRPGAAGAYVVLSVVAGVAAFLIGRAATGGTLF